MLQCRHRYQHPALARLGQRWGTHAAATAAALGNTTDSTIARSNSATCSLLLGEDPQQAAHQLGAALETAVRLGNYFVGVETLLRLAAAFSENWMPAQAAGFAAAARRFVAERGGDIDPANGPLMTKFLDPLTHMLSPEADRDAVAEWEQLTWEEVAEKALRMPQLKAPQLRQD